MPSSDRDEEEYTDTADLQRDLQHLLSDAFHSDIVVKSGDGHAFAVHSQILRVRNSYFAVALKPTWANDCRTYTFPHIHSAHLQDVLEFITTACVRLHHAPHALAVASAAHYLHVQELCHIATDHLRKVLTLSTLADTLRMAIEIAPIPDCLTHVLQQFVLKNARHVLVEKAMMNANVYLVRVVLLLFANALQQGEMVATHTIDDLCKSLSRSVVSKERRLLLFNNCTVEERAAVLSVLDQSTPLVFARYIEPLGLYSTQEGIHKYRDDALLYARRNESAPRRYVLCESGHPHARYARAQSTARKVCIARAPGVIRFDRRSRLGKGARLLLFKDCPCPSHEPWTVLEGRLPDCITIDTTTFWYAFERSAECRNFACKWGWRFFVYPAADCAEA